MIPGARPIWTPGAWLAGFMSETTKHRYILNLLALGFIEDFWMFFSYIALYKHMIPWGVASLEPRGFIGRIYVGDH